MCTLACVHACVHVSVHTCVVCALVRVILLLLTIIITALVLIARYFTNNDSTPCIPQSTTGRHIHHITSQIVHKQR